MQINGSILVPSEDDPAAEVAALRYAMVGLLHKHDLLPEKYRLEYDGGGMFSVTGSGAGETWLIAVDEHDPNHLYPLTLAESLIWQSLDCFPLSLMESLARVFRRQPGVEREWFNRIVKNGESPPDYPQPIAGVCALRYRAIQEKHSIAST